MADDIQTTFDFPELFTVAARHILRAAAGRDLVFSFDCAGPLFQVHGRPAAMRRSLHRLLCGATEVIESGFVMLDATIRSIPSIHSATSQISVRAAGVGVLATDHAVSAVLSRLQLVPDPQPGEQARVPSPRLRRASGDCPITGARISYASAPSAGFVFCADLSLPIPRPDQAKALSPDAQRAAAWVVDMDRPAGEALARRLQRFGWTTTRLASCRDAVRRLRGMSPDDARPSVLVVMESQQTPAPELQALRSLLPAAARCIYGVRPASPSLGSEEAIPGFETWVRPFSEAELHRLTAGATASMERPPGTATAPLVLIADDDETNRIVTAAMVRSLGFEAVSASNGVEAIERCDQVHPMVVLMDLDMPLLDGLAATRQLREMERAGQLPPCCIVAATADDSAEARLACAAAGMDGYLRKPLLLPALRSELQRLCSGCFTSARTT